MLSLISRSLLVLLLVLVVAILTAVLIDEKSGHTTVSLCKLRNGETVVVHIVYHSIIARVLRFLSHNQLYAITLWNRVYVSSSYLIPAGIQHELEHVRQWHDMGPLQFIAVYLWDLWRYGYAKHPLEVAARAISGDVLR